MPLSQSMTQEIDTQGKDRWRGQHRRPKLVSGWSRHVLIAALSGSIALALTALPFSTSNVDDALVKPAQAIPRQQGPALVYPDECSYLPCDAAIREQQPASRKERRSKVKPVPMPLIKRIGPMAITMPAITRDRVIAVKPVGFVKPVSPSPVDTDPDAVPPNEQPPPVEQPPSSVEQPPVEPPATPLPPPAPPIPPVDDDDEDTNCAERWGYSTKEHREDRRARNPEDQQETAEASSEHESERPSAQPVVEGTGTETPAAG